MTPTKAKFVYEVAKAVRLDAGELTLQAIDKMTSHVRESEYVEFITKIADGVDYARPLEIIKKVADKYLDVIKDELFKDVEAEAKEIERKLERKFIMIEELFSPARGHKELIEKWKTPKAYIEAASIDKTQWSDKESYILDKIGFRVLYELYNNPYQHVHKVVEREMKSAITRKHLICDKKQIEQTAKPIMQLAKSKII